MAGRIGLTMRIESPAGGSGPTDTLAPEWPPALRRALGAARWLSIPNLGADAARFLRPWRLAGVVLTGGADVGSCPERDETERHLIDDCIRRRRPLLGVCRGLQILQKHFGGKLTPAPPEHDRGRVHAIEICHDRGRKLLRCDRFSAPSYHRLGVAVADLAGELDAWAVSEDGLVEGLHHRELPIVAVQWHPERPLPRLDLADRLLRSLHDGWRL
jgi:N5-(cytidine 5'-diphosphoramidyl)-L-glutamine hydrolase